MTKHLVTRITAHSRQIVWIEFKLRVFVVALNMVNLRASGFPAAHDTLRLAFEMLSPYTRPCPSAAEKKFFLEPAEHHVTSGGRKAPSGPTLGSNRYPMPA